MCKRGSGLAGGLALPVRVGLNLSCRRRHSLILAVPLTNYRVKLVRVLLVLLSGESHQAVPWGAGWAR